MPLISWGDVVNKTDADIRLEPGESIEAGIEMVGDEVRIVEVPGDE